VNFLLGIRRHVWRVRRWLVIVILNRVVWSLALLEEEEEVEEILQ